MKRRTKKLIVIIMIVLPIITFPCLLILFILTNKPEEVESCKTFVLNNKSVNDYFGTIKSISLGFEGGGQREGVTGFYSFTIHGEKHGTKRIRVMWQKKDDKMNITMLTTREGLASTRVLWPESEATSPRYLLPSHTWDGIILLVSSFVLLFFYINTKQNGLLVKLCYPVVAWTGEKGRKIAGLGFLAAAIGTIIYSILCFLNIYTLF